MSSRLNKSRLWSIPFGERDGHGYRPNLDLLRLSFILGVVFTVLAKPAIGQAVIASDLKVSLEEHLVIGDDESAASQSLLGHPRFIRTDNHNNIYIADLTAMGVKVYDAHGRFMYIIGRRGRGEGELQDISAMHVDDNNDVIVADYINKKLTRFTPSGEVRSLHSIDPEQMIWPRELQQLKSGEYIFLYRMPHSDQPLHVFRDDFERVIISFGSLSFLGDLTNPFLSTMVEIKPGSIWVDKDGSLLYAPFLYTGRLFRYKMTQKDWVETNVFERDVEKKKAYTVLDNLFLDKASGKPYHVSIRKGRQRFLAQLHNESRGIFSLNDGRIAHFSMNEVGAYRLFGVELFEQDGDFIGYAPIDRVKLVPGEAVDIPLYVKWKDREDRFYILDMQSFPVVRVVKLLISETAPSN